MGTQANGSTSKASSERVNDTQIHWLHGYSSRKDTRSELVPPLSVETVSIDIHFLLSLPLHN